MSDDKDSGGFYNSIAKKYNTNTKKYGDSSTATTKPDPFSIGTKAKTSDRPWLKRGPKLTLEKVIRSVNEIKNNTGFNTNAPDSMFSYAKLLFGELREELVKIETSASNFKFFEIAEYSLFQKFDHMDALENLGRIELE